MHGPLLPDFHHAAIHAIRVGPRREIALSIARLLWVGTNGRYAPPVVLRFGGIDNFARAEIFFRTPYYHHSELAYLRYDEQHTSNPNLLFVCVAYERVEANFTVACRSVTISEAEAVEATLQYV